MPRRHHSRRGASAVEFALTLPPLLMMLTGIMDYGWFYAQQHALNAAATTGARAGALVLQENGPEDAAATAALEHWTDIGMHGQPIIVTTRVGSPEQMVVTLSLEATTLVGLVPSADTIEARSIRQMEDQP